MKTPVVLLLLAAVSRGADPSATHTDVFRSGEEGYRSYRIPAIVAAADGSLLAFAEGRKENQGDPGDGDYDAGDADDDTRRNTYFFGNIQGAGRPTAVIRYGEHWPKHVPLLDTARTTARGLPRRPTPTMVTAPWTAIGSLERFGAASASRLLVAERPDLYLMLNNASRAGLASITGVSLPVMLQVPGVERHYRDMLEQVYASDWWREPRPRPLRNAFIWDCRVALLDVFAYDEDWKKNS